MRAAQYYSNTDVRLVELPVPEIGPGELLVRIAACGVCGSDALEWYMRPRAPLFIGHEPAGTVVAVGAGVSKFQVGDRVFVHHHVPCGECYFCSHGHETLCFQHRQTHLDPGGMAEFVRVPAQIVARDVLKLPATLSWDQAVLIEPVSCCVRAFSRLKIDTESVVLIIGGGFAGLVLTQLARHAGASAVVLIEPVPFRRARGRDLGATLCLDPHEADLRTQLIDHAGRAATTAIIATSYLPAISQAVDLVEKAATVLLYAPPPSGQPVSLDLERLFFHEWTITASYGSGPDDTRAALRLLAQGAVDASKLVTDRFPLERAGEAIARTANPGTSLKCVVEIGIES